MKKHLQFVLLTIFALFMLAACGQSENQPGSNNTDEGISSDHNPDLQSGEQGNENEPEENTNEPNEGTNDPTSTSESKSSTHTVYLYFSDNELMDMYKVEVNIEATDKELAKKALEAWIAGPKTDRLASLVPSTVKVQSIENKDGVAYVSFSKELLAANVGSSGEAMLLDQIALMMEQFNFAKTQILIEGEIKDELFGHIMTNEPIEAPNPNDYKLFEN